MDKEGQAGVQITRVALILMRGEREGRGRGEGEEREGRGRGEGGEKERKGRGEGDMRIRGECDCCSLVTISECAAQTLMCFSHISTATSPTSFCRLCV